MLESETAQLLCFKYSAHLPLHEASRFMTGEERARLTRTIIAGVAGSEEGFALDEFRAALATMRILMRLDCVVT